MYKVDINHIELNLKRTHSNKIMSSYQSKSKTLALHFNKTMTIVSALPKLRKIAFNQQHIKYLKFISFAIIILNCVILCIDGPYFSKNTLILINRIDFCFLLIFYIEIVLKIIFQKIFFENFLNFIDFLLFLLNMLVQISLTALEYDIFNQYDIKVYNLIRSLQIIRISRIMVSSSWQSISVLIKELIKIIKTMVDFLLLLIIILLLFTLIGRDLFKFDSLTTMPIQEEIIRVNFDNFFNAFFTNFLIFIGEEWHLIMFAHMKTWNSSYSLFFVLNLIISTIFLNKIFLASLINNLIESKNIKYIIAGGFHKPFNFDNFNEKIHNIYSNMLKIIYHNRIFLYLNHVFSLNKLVNYYHETYIYKNASKLTTKNIEILRKITINRYFSAFIMISTIISLIILAMQDPYQSSDSIYNSVLRTIDIPIFITFSLELLAEIYIHENGYMSYSILLKLFMCFLYFFYFIYEIEVFKLLLIIRLFVLINLFKELKMAFKALFMSLIDILQLFFFFMLVGILFALIGVKFFKGAFYYCDGVDEEGLVNVIVKQDCFDRGGDWINHDFNFDDIFKALEMVFFVGNTEGWLDLM